MKINNGSARNTKLIVTATLGSVLAPTYPHEYSILTFPGTQQLTATQYAELSNAEFQSRVTAFLAYVTAQEPGLIISSSPEFANPGNCPIGA